MKTSIVWSAGILLAVAFAPAAQAQVFRGILLDDETEEPLSAVTIEATDARGATVRRVRTERDGRFQLSLPRAGSYRLQAAHLGYAASRSAEILVGGSETVDVEFRLSSSAMVMEPLKVVASPLRMPRHPFYDRREAVQRTRRAYFVDREEIERRHPHVISEMFRSVPGIRLAAHPRRPGRNILVMRGSCVPTVWIDSRAMRVSGEEVDVYVVPDLVEGIEVYARSGVPAEFYDPYNPNCGVVVIWTRTSSDGQAGRRG